ncbi:unnamed protein product [Meloidogyne enterolobii]
MYSHNIFEYVANARRSSRSAKSDRACICDSNCDTSTLPSSIPNSFSLLLRFLISPCIKSYCLCSTAMPCSLITNHSSHDMIVFGSSANVSARSLGSLNHPFRYKVPFLVTNFLNTQRRLSLYQKAFIPSFGSMFHTTMDSSAM